MSLWTPAAATARARPEFKAQKKGPEMKYSSKVYNRWRRWSTGEEAPVEGSGRVRGNVEAPGLVRGGGGSGSGEEGDRVDAVEDGTALF